jgi:hypothetical protein
MLDRVIRVRAHITIERFGREVEMNLSESQDVVPAQNIGERVPVPMYE